MEPYDVGSWPHACNPEVDHAGINAAIEPALCGGCSGSVLTAVVAGTGAALVATAATALPDAVPALALQSLLDDVGVPESPYGSTFASEEQVVTMIADPRVQGVSLTGWDRAGAAVAVVAGRHRIKYVLELGGSDPFILLDKQDVACKCPDRLRSSAGTQRPGLRCAQSDPPAKHFCDNVVAHIAELARADQRPLSSLVAAEHGERRVREAADSGATLHTGGERSGA